MNAKAKGNRNEHKSIRLLEAAGYACTRAAASLGVFDIVAVGADDVLLIQVKSNRAPGAKEMETIRLFQAPANCRKLIHVWVDRASEPDVREIDSRSATRTCKNLISRRKKESDNRDNSVFFSAKKRNQCHKTAKPASILSARRLISCCSMAARPCA